VSVVTGTLAPVAERSATLVELTYALQAAAALSAAARTGMLRRAGRRRGTPNCCWSRSSRSG
jgi:hypothetical protein